MLLTWSSSVFFSSSAGEAAEADISGAEEFRNTVIVDLLKTYRPEDIYNADETAIYFRALPDSTYVEKEKKAQKGFKTAKDRITLLVVCNMNGDKEELLLIGQSKFPRCFKNVKSRPIPYDFSANAWMTRAIFERWIRSWDHRLQRSGKKVVVLVDNCSAHANVDGLKNIVLRFFPPNTTSVLQPCDMGIIRALKAYFRHEMRQKIIDVIDDAEVDTVAQSVAKSINVFEAMHMIKNAWMKITGKTIRNCWIKGGFVTSPAVEEEGVNDDNTSITLPEPPAGLTQKEFDAWLAIDDDVPIMQELTEEGKTKELVTEILEKDNPEPVSEDMDSDSDDEAKEPTPSAAEMRRCLHRLGVGLERLGFADLGDFYALKKRVTEDLRKKCPPKQVMMDHFIKL